MDQRLLSSVVLMATANPRGTRKVRPGVVLLLTVLGLAVLLATLPDYWDWDLHRLREVIRRDLQQSAMYAGSIQVVAAERRANAEARRTASEIARIEGRVTGSIRGLFDRFVTDIVEQPDGRIVVVGMHNIPGVGVARLNADGSLDEEFVRNARSATAAELTGSADQVMLAPDGTVLVAGEFAVDLRPVQLVRFLSDGTVDEPFLAATAVLPPDPAFQRRPFAAIQPDGSIVFAEAGAEQRPPVRLRSDGAIDRSWDPGAGGTGWRQPFFGADRVLVPKPPGLPEIEPPFAVYVGSVPFGRTTAGTGSNVMMEFLGVQPDGRALLLRHRELELTGPPEPIDHSFPFGGDDTPGAEPWESHLVRTGNGPELEVLGLRATPCEGPSLLVHVEAIAFLPDGGALLAGDLAIPRAGIDAGCDHVALWRVTSDGALDPRFRSTMMAEMIPGREASRIHKIIILRDGRIVIGGAFTSVQGQPRIHLARLRPDGSVE